MSEELIDDVKPAEEAVASQDTENVQAPEEAQEAAAEPKEGSKEYNFARLREQKEQLERQNRELMDAVRGIKDSLKANQAPAPEEQDELASLADDDIITAAQARKLAARMAKQAIDETLAQHEKASLPDRARQKHNDFDDVLTEENIKEFEKQNPVLAAACARADNPWQAAYEAIKMTPIYQDREAKKRMQKDAKTMDKNISKPVSANALGSTGALANANAYGEMSKDELYREMMKAARQA